MIPIRTPLGEDELRSMGALELAHVGDAVYELLVRTRLSYGGAMRLGERHKAAIAWVSAPAQAAALASVTPLLTEEERRILRRGRNARVHSVPSGCTIAQYHAATALEALFGWLWLSGRAARAETLFDAIAEEEDHAH